MFVAGLWHPSRLGGHGCIALYRFDRPSWDRSAPHQPVSYDSPNDWQILEAWDGLLTSFSLCQFPLGSLWSVALVFTKDKFQREDFYDPRHQSHLPLVTFRLRESQVCLVSACVLFHMNSVWQKTSKKCQLIVTLSVFFLSEATSQQMICCTQRRI